MEEAAPLVVGAGVCLALAPLNGGIDWMNMTGLWGLPVSVFAGGLATLEPTAVELVLGLRAASTIFPLVICGPRAGTCCVVLAGPICRACVELASFVDFSRICFCLSSSLANIVTKSSGIGLLSYCGIESQYVSSRDESYYEP